MPANTSRSSRSAALPGLLIALFWLAACAPAAATLSPTPTPVPPAATQTPLPAQAIATPGATWNYAVLGDSSSCKNPQATNTR